MKKRDDSTYLQHILGAIENIQTYSHGLDASTFANNGMAHDAVIRQFEIIGEATKNLSVIIKQKSAHVPWKKIAGTRDILIHQYFGIDMEAIWQYVINDIPILKSEIEQLIKQSKK